MLSGGQVMKTLLILRHAQAVHDSHFADHERPLTHHGVREARRIGRVLRGLRPDFVFSSTALRTRSTLEHALAVARSGPPVEYLNQLYDTDLERHLDALRHADATVDRLLVVGHNPTLENLLSQLVSRSTLLRTGALAIVAMDLVSWQALESSTRGALVGLFDPGMLKKKAPAEQA